MGRAHEATVRRVVDAAQEYDIGVMGDNLAADDRIANAAGSSRSAWTSSSITSATTSAGWSRA